MPDAQDWPARAEDRALSVPEAEDWLERTEDPALIVAPTEDRPEAAEAASPPPLSTQVRCTTCSVISLKQSATLAIVFSRLGMRRVLVWL